MPKTEKPDPILVYKLADGLIRWTRRSAHNGLIIAASTESYARKRGAVANIYRTQKMPYHIVIDDSL